VINPTYLQGLEVLLAALSVLRARTPGTPAGDADDPDEDNTFDLPNGNPLRRKLKQFAHRQLKKMLGTIPTIGAPLPDSFPPLTDWTDPMASAMTPMIGAYWDEAGKTTRAKLGLDPERWEVADPHLHEMISKQTFDFCAATNATTDKELGEALEDLRAEFIAGLVDRGDTIPELTARVKKVFGRMATWRAEMIARTEASRAVHSASLQSAKESGVVAGKKWLVSANSCDRCQALAAQFNAESLALDASFTVAGSNTTYAIIQHPPLHPHCRCSLTYRLTDEYEALLKLHPPESGSGYSPGPLGPDPVTSPKPAKKPRVPRPAKPKPRPEPEPPVEVRPAAPRPPDEPIPPKPIPPGPAGTPVGKALHNTTQGQIKREVQGAIDAIDKVHGDGALPRIPIQTFRSARTNGEFRFTASGRAVDIQVTKTGTHPITTTLHEIGHFLEFSGIPRGPQGTREFSDRPEFKEWMESVKSSEAFRGLRKLAATKTLLIEKPDGTKLNYTVDRAYAKYLLQPEELWARAYAQYIAKKSGSQVIMDQIDLERNENSIYAIRQWSDSDFEPILKSIDSMFAALGWIK
jgi:hypothetical protein